MDNGCSLPVHCGNLPLLCLKASDICVLTPALMFTSALLLSATCCPMDGIASIHVLHAMTEPLFNRKDLVHPSRHRRRRRPTKQKIWRFDGACGKTKAWKPRSDCLLQAGCCSGDQDLACSGLFLLLCTYTSISLRTWTNTRPPRKLERKFRAGWSQSPLFV